MKTIWWHTDKAEQWIRENIHFESWQELGNGIAVEYRMADDIIDGMLNDGLTNADFSV